MLTTRKLFKEEEWNTGNHLTYLFLTIHANCLSDIANGIWLLTERCLVPF